MLSQSEKWLLAKQYTKSNTVLIRCIAGPFMPHMPVNQEDLEAEALLVAFETISKLNDQQVSFTHMTCWFRKQFRTHCVKLAAGVPLAREYEIERYTSEKVSNKDVKTETAVVKSLTILTKRQREIVHWILKQDIPVNTKKTGAHFGVSARAIRLIINNAITRLNGHNGIRKNIQITA